MDFSNLIIISDFDIKQLKIGGVTNGPIAPYGTGINRKKFQMNKITIIFPIIVVLFSALVLIEIFSRQESVNPVETMKNVLHGTRRTKEKTLKINMRLANLDELYKTGVYDKFKELKTKKKPEEYPVLISGELSKRKIVFAFLPVYPRWAKNRQQKIEVVLRFQVLPQGQVKNNISVIKSSGYEDVDKIAIEVLKRWFFYPLDKPEDQSGQISFRFKL